ncbi:Phosphate metabolism transcription protein [Fusarium torreyae]|uniref:Phosphate metabolism transcription protein n=1 Tax=Fusarium torreyae TaxID=1237075 RepID=A0A9W8S1Z1_9HYPO|nr:Phosphate metabolism transcription protein [Fusarium torreyae]
MRFGRTLRESIYPPWKDKYIDYAKLKSLLREDVADDDNQPWTEEDETRFCEEIFNKQLEKVAQFQEQRFNALKERVESAFEKLKELAPVESSEEDGAPQKGEISASRLRTLESELDEITNEVRELKKYSNINYTGFLKIIKKHDRKRGDRYKVRPMMQLSLSQRPFNSETGYSPLLNKLSIMYFAIRQQLEESGEQLPPLDLESQGETHNGERYTAHKFWVHPDNLLEVKTVILRHLPALVYSEQSAKELDGSDSPSITSLYFDNKQFELYGEKVNRQSEATSLRLRWYGQLVTRPEIFVEEKTVDNKGGSQDLKFSIKDKYVKSFVDGDYKTEKAVQKMKRQSFAPEKIEEFKETVNTIQKYVKEKSLSPVLRANYVRTAFQKPADDRIRIAIDTDVAFIREDTLDSSRPCRDPNEWHRLDIDDSEMTYPFKKMNQSEVNRFPYALLEIKLKEGGLRKRPTWIEDLMASHLVHPTPRFSKFVHGIAVLFEDYVNNLPFWLSDLESDIRKDPQKTFEEEEQRRAQRHEDVMAVGSLIGAGAKSGSYKPTQSSPVSKSYLADRMSRDSIAQTLNQRTSTPANGEENGESSAQREEQERSYGTLSSVIPGFSLSKYSKAKRASQQPLPEGVVAPTEWIKNMGELKVEPKVWLANERTFLKWQHICILQGGLAVGLYTAAGENTLASVIGLLFVLIAIFAGAWGYAMLRIRRTMILERSGKDFDNMIGPMIISASLMIVLILNFFFAYREAFGRFNDGKHDGGELLSEDLK